VHDASGHFSRMGTPMPAELSLNLPRELSAAGVARHGLRKRLADVPGQERTGQLMLVVSELVTNAVVHGSGAILLRLRVDDDRVYGEVIDEGGGFEQEVRKHGHDDVGGRGLQIVEALSSRWGIHEGATHVWFELSPSEAPAKPTDPELGGANRPASLDAPQLPE
jgi:anti-sigma regulatory factor (Ser/Thr protein kinase)